MGVTVLKYLTTAPTKALTQGQSRLNKQRQEGQEVGKIERKGEHHHNRGILTSDSVNKDLFE